MTQIDKSTSKTNLKRASVSDPKGSLTAEAALTIPVFLFAVLCIICLMEIQALRISIRQASLSAAKIAAEEVVLLPVLNPVKLKYDIVKSAGESRLDQSLIEGGSAGLHCFTSWYEPEIGILHIRVTYKVRLPFPGFTHLGTKQKQEFIVKAWTGYEKPGLEDSDDSIVYVTETGGVYHTDYQCTYLQLSVRFVPYAGLSGFRNLDGAIYHACEKCVNGSAMAGIYITDNGTKYHNSLNCSGLKRTVRAVKKSEVSGLGVCSRCSQ